MKCIPSVTRKMVFDLMKEDEFNIWNWETDEEDIYIKFDMRWHYGSEETFERILSYLEENSQLPKFYVYMKKLQREVYNR